MAGSLKADEMRETIADPEKDGIASKTWVWRTRIQRGDCTINEDTNSFVLYSDGSTEWQCDIRSRDESDKWTGKFEVSAANGALLFTTNEYWYIIAKADQLYR
jgi:hypothetical protein